MKIGEKYYSISREYVVTIKENGGEWGRPYFYADYEHVLTKEVTRKVPIFDYDISGSWRHAPDRHASLLSADFTLED